MADSNSHAASHLRQKRARSQLSCTPCRNGKLKCNRSHEPACDQCIKRNRESACQYAPPPLKHRPAQNVKGRIRQLESLVVDLMNQQGRQAGGSGGGGGGGGGDGGGGDYRGSGVGGGGDGDGERGSTAGGTSRTVSEQASSTSPQLYSELTPPSDNDPSPHLTDMQRSANSPESVERPFGQMKISKDEISYHGASHWQSILDSISDLKRELGDDDDAANEANADAEPAQAITWQSISTPIDPAQPRAATGMGFLLGSQLLVSRDDLIKSLPEKRATDRLLSLWFNSPDPVKPVIHAPTFQEEYRRFWRNPNEAPVMWLGLFYAILSLAESFGLRDVDLASPSAQACLARVNKYHDLAAAAAVLADFTKPKQYTLECLILYASGLHSNNAFVNVWLMIGMVVRLALRMGYHRDPSQYPNISPFQAEMRRRVWSIISMIDVLVSFQLGLPSMVRTIATDAEPPSNLLDRDFNESTTSLPPGRSIGELTPSSYTRAKVRIVRIFAQAAELSHATVPPSYEEVMRLDSELEQAKDAIPPLLQMSGVSELVTEPAEHLMCSFNLDLLYLKTKTVLHRRYMLTPLSQLSPAEQALGIGRSRKICTDCALKVLKHHHTIYQASQSGGQLASVKWYMGSISTHDFLLAAMVICLELSQQISAESSQTLSSGRQCPRRAMLMDALEQSHRIWTDSAPAAGVLTSPGAHLRPEHMLSETEKASKAMGVMLERVRAHFDKPTPHTTSAVPASSHQSSTFCAGPGFPADRPARSHFDSIFPSADWTDPSPSFALDSSPFTNTGLGTGSLAGQPLAEVLSAQPYSMIGDMIAEPTALDWQLWDNTTLQQNPQSYTPWNESEASITGAATDDPLTSADMNTNMNFSAANILSGSGPIAQNRYAVSLGGLNFNWQDLQGVDLDVGDYGTGALWARGTGTEGPTNADAAGG